MNGDTTITTLVISIICIAFIILGIYLLKIGYKGVKNAEKYEFDNRSSHNVIGFDNYEQSRNHNRSKGGSVLAMVIGFAMAGISSVVLFFFLTLYSVS